jgi:hypothetical protein
MTYLENFITYTGRKKYKMYRIIGKKNLQGEANQNTVFKKTQDKDLRRIYFISFI